MDRWLMPKEIISCSERRNVLESVGERVGRKKEGMCKSNKNNVYSIYVIYYILYILYFIHTHKCLEVLLGDCDMSKYNKNIL